MRAKSRTFGVMGSRATVVVTSSDDALLDHAVDRIRELERRWSRFQPDSEVSRLNAAAGEPLQVSASTALLVARARQAWELTDGAFDPTLLRTLERLGYDRPFERLGTGCGVPTVARAPIASPRQAATRSPAAIRVEGDTVQLPLGAAFDPGGIGKGLAADLVATELVGAGARGALVDIGGDIRVAGRSPDPAGWGVEVEDYAGSVVALLSVAAGAVATTTSARRRWEQPSARGPVDRHHLIDPSTGEPATGPVRSVTVVAGEAWLAEVLATATFLRGPLGWLREYGATGLVTVGDHVVALDGVTEYLR